MIIKNALALLLGTALAIPAGVAAQPPGRGPMRGPGPGMGMQMGICPMPQGGSQARGEERGPRNPIRCLVEREELSLNDDQVGRLEKLAEELDQKNAPLIAKLNELRPDSGRMGGDRQAMRQRMEEMGPLFREVRANTEKSFGAALQVLTEEQRATVEAAMRQGRPGRPGGPAFRSPGGQRGAALMRRGAMLMRRGQRMMMQGAMMMQRGRPGLGPGGGG